MSSDTTPPPEHCCSKLISRLSTAQSADDVQAIVDRLDDSLLPENQVERMLRQLLRATDHAQLLELVLACGSWSQRLSAWLLKGFPKHSTNEFETSIHSEILERLSLFLLFLPYTFEQETQLFLSEARFQIERIPPILKYMVHFVPGETEDVGDPDEADPDGFVIGKKQKQSQQKKARKVKKSKSNLKQQDLIRLNVTDPRTKEEAAFNAELLLDMLKVVLLQYLDLLQNRNVCLAIQNMSIIRAPVDTGDDEQRGQQQTRPSAADEAVADPIPSAYPCVQPMKAALYFESASGFGEWRILISTRADRDLREARRSDAKFFKIVIKKIIELSNGHFSDDNQKRLNKADVEFPVFEAKMTRDSRLVYQIDCIPEYDNDFERQVIKIFGIYTHAQIDKRFWDSMGYQLSKKGKTYRDRCTFRNRPHHKGDNVILPATFPPPEKEVFDTSIIPALPKEDLEEIHSLLVLEKFVTLSKELLKSIFAELEVAHVFDVSPQEKEIIEHQNSCYVLGRSGTGKTTTMLFKMLGIERAYAQQSELSSIPRPRQIFVTQSRVLATRVEEYFSKLLESLAAANKSKEELKQIAEKKKLQKEGDIGLYDVNDDVTWKAGLPHKFSLLQDEHFPLFLTYERLCQLLQGDCEKALAGATSDEKPLITYDTFLEQYWPHFPQDLTKNLDPALVFSELLGVIEGSEQSLTHESRYLDLTSYSNLSHRAQHVFAKQRDRIYLLFQAYMKFKKQRGEFDAADRTHRVLTAFDKIGIPGMKIDFLYVDEAQDNLLIDTMLLRSLCSNPNGLFWAGDTAQTIAIGSSFRFNDLKAFLYRLEQRREQDHCSVTQSELRTFQLVVNYRSHAGIVRCATAVIELITHFWPYAIDSLAPEEGIVDGAKPVFFSGWDTNTVRYEQFLFGDSGERIEFGARQCILVRDEAAKTELRKQVGDIGLILTLYESKGLEFDDVLLYKFFEDSTVDLGQWRIVLNLLETGHAVSAPRFDEERHAGVCSELKFLYVAITRSRKNLWIVDCSDKAEPMKMLWESKGYIQNCVPGGDVPRLAVSSTPEEWETTGRALFTNRRYLQAMHSFERAGMAREAKISYTHYLRDIARSIQAVNKETRCAKRDAFCSAANSFLECAHGAKGKEQRVFFHNAGDCFEKAGSCSDNPEDYGKAAWAYENATEYTPAVRLYRKTEMFNEAVSVVQNHRHQIDEELANSVLEIARLYYFKNKEFGKAKMLFDSVEEELEYLEDNILLDDCYAAVLADLGRYQEAAEIHLAEGRTMEAVEALLNDRENVESNHRATCCILQGLWESTSFSQRIKPTDVAARTLLQRASKVDKDVMLLTPTQKDELDMFQALCKSTSPLRQLAYRFLGRKEIHQAVLCFDHHFINFPSTLEISNADLVVILADFYQYCRSFRDLILRLVVGDGNMQRLFNFHPASIQDTYRVKTDTWLYRQVTDATARLRILESDDEFIVVSGDELQQLLKAVLWRRLERRILDENNLCQRIPVFTPCLPFLMNGDCRLVSCTRYHIGYQQLTQTWFNNQVRIHLLQILIYHVYLGIPIPNDRNQTIQDRRYWIHRLHETLRPAAHFLGSEASVRQAGANIPEAELGSQTVVKWLRDILGNWTLPFDRMLLTFLYEAASLLMRFDTVNSRNDLERAPLLRVFAGQVFYYRFKETIYVVPELAHCLRAADRSFISAGILFFQHIVDRGINIDVNVLCHLSEFLVGSVIFARAQFNLHYVTLPRSWILTLLRQITMHTPDTMLIDKLLRSMQSLLEHLIKGGDGARYLLFEGRYIAELPGLRDLFIHRICRALALLGRNIPNDDLQRDIYRILRVLETTRIHESFRRYAKARGWGGLVVAAQASCADSHLDEMIQLCSTEKPAPEYPPPEHVRRVFFRRLEDIRPALSTDPSSGEATSVSTNQSKTEVEPPSADASITGAEPLAPNVQGNPTVEGLDLTAEMDQQVDYRQIEQPEADITDVVDSGDLVDSLVNTTTSLPDVEHSSPEQEALALRLFHKYQQRTRNRKLEKHKSPTQKAWDSYFETCFKLASDPKEMQWPCGFYYRKLYLGLVPHLLVCIKAVESYAFNARARARIRFWKEEKQDYDGTHKRMNEIGAVVKGCKRLGQQLHPSSEVHKKRDIQRLKQLVYEVEQLVNQVPLGAALEVQFSLQLAIKGIVTEPKPKQLKETLKAELNMDMDDDYLDYDYYDDGNDLAYDMYY